MKPATAVFICCFIAHGASAEALLTVLPEAIHALPADSSIALVATQDNGSPAEARHYAQEPLPLMSENIEYSVGDRVRTPSGAQWQATAPGAIPAGALQQGWPDGSNEQTISYGSVAFAYAGPELMDARNGVGYERGDVFTWNGKPYEAALPGRVEAGEIPVPVDDADELPESLPGETGFAFVSDAPDQHPEALPLRDSILYMRGDLAISNGRVYQCALPGVIPEGRVEPGLQSDDGSVEIKSGLFIAYPLGADAEPRRSSAPVRLGRGSPFVWSPQQSFTDPASAFGPQGWLTPNLEIEVFARHLDTAGNSVLTDRASIRLLPPAGQLSVRLDSPMAGSTIASDKHFSIEASVWSPEGAAEVAVHVDGAQIESKSGSGALAFEWTPDDAGAQTLMAIATDAAGRSGVAGPIEITVADEAPGNPLWSHADLVDQLFADFLSRNPDDDQYEALLSADDAVARSRGAIAAEFLESHAPLAAQAAVIERLACGRWPDGKRLQALLALGNAESMAEGVLASEAFEQNAGSAIVAFSRLDFYEMLYFANHAVAPMPEQAAAGANLLAPAFDAETADERFGWSVFLAAYSETPAGPWEPAGLSARDSGWPAALTAALTQDAPTDSMLEDMRALSVDQAAERILWSAGFRERLSLGWLGAPQLHDMRGLPWLGRFDDTLTPWIWHAEHGWMHSISERPDNILFWDAALGWLWTSSDAYPHLFSYERSAWIYYYRDSTDPRWFHSWKTGQSFHIP